MLLVAIFVPGTFFVIYAVLKAMTPQGIGSRFEEEIAPIIVTVGCLIVFLVLLVVGQHDAYCIWHNAREGMWME